MVIRATPRWQKTSPALSEAGTVQWVFHGPCGAGGLFRTFCWIGPPLMLKQSTTWRATTAGGSAISDLILMWVLVPGVILPPGALRWSDSTSATSFPKRSHGLVCLAGA